MDATAYSSNFEVADPREKLAKYDGSKKIARNGSAVRCKKRINRSATLVSTSPPPPKISTSSGYATANNYRALLLLGFIHKVFELHSSDFSLEQGRGLPFRATTLS